MSFVSLFFCLKIAMKGRKKMMIIIEEFKINLIGDSKSNNTVQSYVGDITAFLKYLGTMGVEFDGTLKRFYITSYKSK